MKMAPVRPVINIKIGSYHQNDSQKGTKGVSFESDLHRQNVWIWNMDKWMITNIAIVSPTVVLRDEKTCMF